MKKLTSIGILLSFLLIRFDMGRDGSDIIGSIEFYLLHDPANLQFPLLLIVLVSQLFILAGIISPNKKNSNFLTTIGIVALSVIALGAMLVATIVNSKNILYGIPFLALTFLYIYLHIRDKEDKQ